ncbi:MAG: T9SS type A sorting domain-containing protein [Bacteroidota bacterium]
MKMKAKTVFCHPLIWNIVLTLGLCLSYSSIVPAQGWQTIHADGQSLSAREIASTPDGGWITVGWLIDDLGEEQILMAKIDVDGTITWTKRLQHPAGATFPHQVSLCANGDYIIAGGFHHPDFLPHSNDSKPYLIRTDPAGNILWQNWYGSEVLPDQREYYTSVLELADGSFIATGVVPDLEVIANRGIITRVDANGNEIWTTITSDERFLSKMITTSDGHVVLIGAANDVIERVALWKIDINGQELWSRSYQTPSYSYAFDALELPDGHLMVTGSNRFDILGNFNYRAFLLKTTATGDSLWLNNYDLSTGDDSGQSIGLLPDGGIAIGGSVVIDPNSHLFQAFMLKTDANGQEEWSKVYAQNASTNWGDLSVCSSGGLVFAGGIRTETYGPLMLYLFKTDSVGNQYSRFLQGQVAMDASGDCAIDSSGFENWMVTATNEDHTFYTRTDSLGNYELAVDEGTYELNVSVPTPYWTPCISNPTVTAPAPYDTLSVHFPMQALVDCPYLTVDMGTPFLRWCSENNYTIRYCNEGTVAATAVTVQVHLDTFLQLLSSNYPIVHQTGNTYTFAVDDLEINECKTLHLNVELACDHEIQGFTHCTEVHIYPDSLCLPSDMVWDGSSLEVQGVCQGDSIHFLIYNAGDDMQGANPFYVIEDQIMLLQGTVLLGAGQDTTISMPATGGTFRMSVEQSIGHPGNDRPSLVIEGCGLPPYSLGFVNNFSQNDGNDFIDIDCNRNISSFDPNDKQGFPEGYDEPHYILPNTRINYRVRFQNTGTDTAFHVIIRDTLSPYLDLETLRISAASHDFRYDINNEGILKFNFNNIELPDSNVNEAASHGFVHFTINPREAIELGTIITNRASIYFDANLPILTNTTWHTVQEDFIATLLLSTEQPTATPAPLKIYPNPSTNYAILEVERTNFQTGLFTLYQTNGQKVLQVDFASPRFRLPLHNLAPGLYFYEVIVDQQSHYQGKLVIKQP